VITVPSGAILTIQDGVDAAAPGDTVLVLPGTYSDDVALQWGPVVGIGPDKRGLKLKAVGPPGSVKIVGPQHGAGIWINADNALVEGFDISGFDTGINAGGWQMQGTRITRNTIRDCSSACINVSGASNYELDHNTLAGGQYGIFLNGWEGAGPNTQPHLHHNRVNGAQFIGIFLWQSPGCTLDHNVCDNNGEFGIYLAGSPNCTADHNQTDNNGSIDRIGPDGIFAGIGILVGDSLNCAVTGNEANNNVACGIVVGSSCGSSFERNVAEGNGQYDLCDPGWGSLPTCNTYLKNRADTAVPSLALWDVKSSK